MSWLQSILVALLTGVAGLFGAGFVSGLYTSWYHMTNREGASGFFVLFMALAGGVASLILGIVVARAVAGSAAPGMGKALLYSIGAVVGIAGVSVLILYFLADFPPRIDGDSLRLEVEIKLPVGHAKPEGEGRFELGSVINHTRRAMEFGELKIAQTRDEGGR